MEDSFKLTATKFVNMTLFINGRKVIAVCLKKMINTCRMIVLIILEFINASTIR
jgi:hypothetical protein